MKGSVSVSVSVQIIMNSDPRGPQTYGSKTLLTRYNHGSCAELSLKGIVVRISRLGRRLCNFLVVFRVKLAASGFFFSKDFENYKQFHRIKQTLYGI
jgi:hypothetical protein